jgi:glycosyltransferase involved in cell wall biosynthesis
MYEKGKVSICLITYNRPTYLKQLLDSILAQSYTNYEIIITDNSETDDTKNMILSGYKDKRIRYYKNETNVGLGKNAIKNFNMVTGEFMTYTPDDDLWIDKDKLKKQIELLNEHQGINIVYSNTERIDDDGKILERIPSVYTEDKEYDILPADHLLPGYSQEYWLNIMTVLLRTDKFLNLTKESFKFNSEEYMCWYVGATEKNIGLLYGKLVAIRDGAKGHYRPMVINGKFHDWEEEPRLRIGMLFDIYDTLIKRYPETVKKLSAPLCRDFLAGHVIVMALQTKNIVLCVKTIFRCYRVFPKFSLRNVFKKR